MKEKLKEHKGIALIALVVTIIVLIILAAVVIVGFSRSGIIDKSNEAKTKYNAATQAEQEELDSAFEGSATDITGTWYLDGDSSNTFLSLVITGSQIKQLHTSSYDNSVSEHAYNYKIEGNVIYTKDQDDTEFDLFGTIETVKGKKAIMMMESGIFLFSKEPIQADDVTISGSYAATFEGETIRFIFSGDQVTMRMEGESDEVMNYKVFGDVVSMDYYAGKLIYDGDNNVTSITISAGDEMTITFVKE